MSLSLRLSWNNGSLPPPHRRATVITIEADGTGTVERYRGYGKEPVATRGFELASPEALAETLRAGGLWRTAWREPERHSVGGGTTYLSATLDGEEASVPAFVVEEQREAKAELVQAVKDAIPGPEDAAHESGV